MIQISLLEEDLLIDGWKFSIGELVMTLLGEYGVIIGIGRHPDHKTDRTEYYKILINGYTYHYLSCGLTRIKKNKILGEIK
jgi:hypothetical protein